MRLKREELAWTAALVAGLALRTLFVWIHPRFVGDTLVYGDLAHNMLAHHVYGLTEERVRPTLIRLPGYPLFLAICFAMFGTANYLAVVWVQVLLDLLGCVLLSLLARRMFGVRVGVVTVWMAALCPFTANYAAAALTETASIFCVTAALWGLARWWDAVRVDGRGLRWALVIGFALMWASLLRPDGCLLAVAVVAGMVWAAWVKPTHRDEAAMNGAPGFRLRALGGVIAASAFVVVALSLWAVRNWRVFHVVQPLAPKYANDPDEPAPLGFARWYRTWAIGFGDTVRVYWTYDGSPLSMSDLPARAFDSEAQRGETAQLLDRYNAESASTPPVEAGFARLAEERVRAHPVRYYVWLPLAKLGDMWVHPRTELMKMPMTLADMRRRPREFAFAMGYGALNVVLLGLGVAGLWRWRRMGWGGYGLVAGVAAGFVVLRSLMLMTIDNSEPRYVLECYPVVILLAAVAVSGWRGMGGLILEDRSLGKS